MHLEIDGQGTLVEQVARALARRIVGGHLPFGSRLPATRDLAAQLSISRNTVVTAYDVLREEGLVVGRRGSGTYVAGAARAPTLDREAALFSPPQSRYAARGRQLPALEFVRKEPPVRFDLQYGEPMLNVALLNRWRSELSSAAARTEARYPRAQGVLVLRHALREYLARRRGVVAELDDIIVVSGTQQAITLCARVLLNENDVVALEDPHYQLAAFALHAHGARVVGVPTDDQGLVVRSLPRSGVKLVYVTPSHQFPSGAVMSAARRASLLQYASEHDAWIFEDDYDAEFRYGAPPVPALRASDAGRRVIYAGSLAKSVLPSIRLGYVVCPPALTADFVLAKRLDDLGCSAVEQVAMAGFVRSGGFETHLRRAVLELRRRRDALLDGLSRHCGKHLKLVDSQAGMHVIAWLPSFSPAAFERLLRLALSRQLRLHSIAPHYMNRPPCPGLLLGFAALSVAQLAAASKVLGECLREVCRDLARGRA